MHITHFQVLSVREVEEINSSHCFAVLVHF